MYQEIAFKEAQVYKPCISFLILTATNVEINEVLKNLEPLPDQEKILKVYRKNYTFYLGKFGAYAVVLTKSEMGSSSTGASMMTTTKAIPIWAPKAVVMIGIAFGVNPEKQQIGDVLVSRILYPYNLKKEGVEMTIQRSEQPRASLSLVNRFNEMREWEYILPNGKQANVNACSLLSGEVLIDNKAYRDALLRTFPEAKGGEMEGNGVYVACNEEKVDWIVIKAICDFADGNKSENKKENQAIAIQSAVSITKKVFSSKYAFEDLEFVLPEDCIGSNDPTESKTQQKASSQPILSKAEAKELRDWIAHNRIEPSLKKLITILEQANNQEYLGEINGQFRAFNDVTKRERIGIISYTEARAVINKIVYSTLEVIERLTK